MCDLMKAEVLNGKSPVLRICDHRCREWLFCNQIIEMNEAKLLLLLLFAFVTVVF